MRRYWVPKFMNRFASAKASLESQDIVGDGYYRASIRALIADTYKYQSRLSALGYAGKMLVAAPLNHIYNEWIPGVKSDSIKYLNEETKERLTSKDIIAIRKFNADITWMYTLSAFTFLISNLVFGGNDKKKKKFTGNAFTDRLLNNIVRNIQYVAMRGTNERKSFVFLPFINFNELSKLTHQPFGLINKPLDNATKLIEALVAEGGYLGLLGLKNAHIYDAHTLRHDLYKESHFTDRRDGHNRGALKATAYLLKTLGLTGNTLHPDRAIQNFEKLQNRNN